MIPFLRMPAYLDKMSPQAVSLDSAFLEEQQ
jgi:hypothetical protein